MVAKELISLSLPTVKTSDNGENALSMMEEFKISHLPIVNNTEFLGMISDLDIFDLKMPQEAIGNHPLSLDSAYVFEGAHIYDVAEIMSRLKITIVPVLDNDKAYLGAITNQRMVQELTQMLAINGPGGIIILQVKEVNYSMFEIARIVEDNGAKIISSAIAVDSMLRLILVTLKFNKEEITSVIKAF